MSTLVCVGGLFDDGAARKLPWALRKLLRNQPEEIRQGVIEAYKDHYDTKGKREWDAPFGSGKHQ